MLKRDTIHRHLMWSAAGAALLAGSIAVPAVAQETETDDRVVVTGSFIAGTPEDAALPVDVTSRQDLEILGTPTLTQFIRNLGVSSGIDGETNQFTSNGLEGSANINLRGLGPARTLVLINGRRQVAAPFALAEQAQLFVDTNQIPVSAIGRIEILKDGAAATYGSDAIAGVVNIITRNDLDGFEVSGDYSFIDGSDGDYSASVSYGWQGDDANFFLTGSFQHRNELPTRERDFALRSFEENPQGGYSSIGNPGTFVSSNTGAFIPDTGCEAVGNTLAAGFCRFQFTEFDNLVEIENRYQIYTEYNQVIFGDVNFHVEGLYAKTDVPDWKTSPSYPPQILTGQVVLPNHPGLIAFQEDNPELAQSFAAGALFFGRGFGAGGFPGKGAQEGSREREMFRINAGLNGTVWDDIGWDFALTYANSTASVISPDIFINNFSLALQGLGGPDCDPATGTPGVGGCQYYNPFSNAIEQNAFGGPVNPQFRPELANSRELAEWLTGNQSLNVETDLFVADLVFNGDTGIDLWGGSIAWAAGGQFRRDGYESAPDVLSDLTRRPCPVEGDFTCDSPTGPFGFLAGTTPFEDDRNVYALFGEVALPVTDTFDVQVAARFESYSGDVGSTFDPKIQARWQATDWLALRGSAQTTFRAPTLNQLAGQATTLQFVAPTSAFKAVDQIGNPDLEGETAFTFNLGALVDLGNFRASIDYWFYDFEDPIIVEPQEAIVSAVIAELAAGNVDAPIVQRITFNGDPAPANIARIETNVINGPNIQTSGIDGSFEFTYEDLGPGVLTIGGDISYTVEYEVDAFSIEGVQVSDAFDAVGQLNRSNFLRSLPQWKGNVNLGYELGRHNFLAVVRHVDSYEDERPEISGNGQEIDSWTTLDLHYNVTLPYDIQGSLSAVNVTDEDPPFARLDLNYDPYTHSAVGRIIKVGLTKRFGGF